MKKIDGHIIAVQGPVVDVRYVNADDVPNIHSIISTVTVDGKDVTLEVAEHREGNVARCIALHSTQNIQRNAPAVTAGDCIMIPDGKDLFSRIVNVTGNPIDQKGAITTDEMFPIRSFQTERHAAATHRQRKRYEIIETGIKIIDLLFPLVKGSKTGILGGAGLGKTLIVLEMIYQMVKKHEGACVFVGVGAG